MEKMNTKEDFLKRFEAAKQRKHEMVENMKEDITVEYEKFMARSRSHSLFFDPIPLIILEIRSLCHTISEDDQGNPH